MRGRKIWTQLNLQQTTRIRRKRQHPPYIMHRKFYSIGSRLEASIFLFVLCCVVYLDSLLLKVMRIFFETSHKILVVI